MSGQLTKRLKVDDESGGGGANLSCFTPVSNKPLQLYILACILLASKSAGCNIGVEDAEIPLEKMHKFANYKFSNSDLAHAELKVMTALGFDLDFENEDDDLYTKLMNQIDCIKNLVVGQSHGDSTTESDEIQWLVN